MTSILTDAQKHCPIFIVTPTNSDGKKTIVHPNRFIFLIGELKFVIRVEYNSFAFATVSLSGNVRQFIAFVFTLFITLENAY